MRTPHRPTGHLSGRVAGALALALAVAGLTGCQPAQIWHTEHTDASAPITHTTTTATTATTGALSLARARAELATLAVRVPDTGAHYRRADWGGWTHTGGCDTRETVLRRDAVPGTAHTATTSTNGGSAHRSGTGCRIVTGRWVSPYDQMVITDPHLVQIDHRVPVKEAAESGARTWTAAERARFYNDPNNLVAVSAHANTSKGDRDPRTWRPANRGDWCHYAAGYVATKHTYRLAVDPPERAGLAAMLNTCPGGGDEDPDQAHRHRRQRRNRSTGPPSRFVTMSTTTSATS
jgi:hypothetical protein